MMLDVPVDDTIAVVGAEKQFSSVANESVIF